MESIATGNQYIEFPDGTRWSSLSMPNLASAMAKAQGSMHAAAKDSKNPHFNSRYADLASIIEACRGPLSSNGLSTYQPTSVHGADVMVTTLLMHDSGEWMSSPMAMTAEKANPQSVGSCITYLRRYGMAALVGVAPDDDDDGNAASGRQQQGGRPPTQPPQSQARQQAAKPAPAPAPDKAAQSAQQPVVQPAATPATAPATAAPEARQRAEIPAMRANRLWNESTSTEDGKPLFEEDELKTYLAGQGASSPESITPKALDIWENELKSRRAKRAAASPATPAEQPVPQPSQPAAAAAQPPVQPTSMPMQPSPAQSTDEDVIF